MYNVLVVFNDGSKKIFNDVIDWGITTDDCCCYIKKIDPVEKGENTVRSFMRKENVTYIGPVEFWEETEESKLIRCKDCKYFNEDPYYFRGRPCCTRLETGYLDNPIPVNSDDFCSRAVRRGEK